jgi:carboxymethylenebutenolidase
MLWAMPSSTIDIDTADGVADAYLTRPDDQPHPGVLFVIDAIGLRPRIEEMADRIAAQGYVVLAPNVFYRGGRAPGVVPPMNPDDPDGRAKFMQVVRPLMEQLTPEAMNSDAEAYLGRLEQEAPGKVAITGYCMGGRHGFNLAAAFPDRVAALGSFHAGGLVTDAPDSPHHAAGDIAAEMYFGHADEDPNMTPEQIAELERALDQAGARYRSELYAGAKHGYTMSDMPVYDEAAAERHFTELFALLDRAL